MDEQIDTLLMTNPTKDTYPIFPWKPKLLPVCIAIISRCVCIKINTVWDDDVWLVFEVKRRSRACADDGIRLPDQVTCDPAVLALGGGGEGNADFCAEKFLLE